MYCEKCGSEIPDDALYCPKCGARQNGQSSSQANGSGRGTQQQVTQQQVIADAGVQELKCPGCGAPIKPLLGEMVITCPYCGSSITLGNMGWRNLEKHTFLPLKIQTQDQLLDHIKSVMDRGLLHRHLEEESKNDGATLTYVPYWIVPVSARTEYTAISGEAEAAQIGTTALLAGLMGGAMGGRGRGGFGTGMMGGLVMGGMMTGGMGLGGNNARRAYSLDQNYQYPVVAVKGLMEYQPRDYSFNLTERQIFDISKIPKGIKILNGDVSDDAAKYEAKTNVDQIQSQKVHQAHHMVQNIVTKCDVAEAELLHVPIWFAKFTHKADMISLVVDGNSGGVINSIGLVRK